MLVKAVGDAGSPVPTDSRYLKPLKTAALLELGRLARLAQEAGVPVKPRLLVGHPAASVEETANGLQSRLVVMGTHGRTGWDRLQLGSTAESVIRHAPCPVLTVHGVVAGESTRSLRYLRIRRLLVTTDFSAAAQGAVGYAVDLARRLEATLLVLHVVDPSEYGPTSPAHNAIGLEALRTSRARRLGRTLAAIEAKPIRVEEACAIGTPIEAILEQAEEWKADVIVIGTHGRRGLHRLMLGSVAEQVVRRAGCPVLTVNRQRVW